MSSIVGGSIIAANLLSKHNPFMRYVNQEIHAVTSQARLEDVGAMANLEASWNFRKLPPNALSETGALFIPLGQEGLTNILSDRNSHILISKESEQLQGMLVACGKTLALAMWPTLSTSYAPGDPIWQETFLYVKTVAVDPASTGKRVGTALVQSLRKLAIETNQKGILAVIAVDPPNKRSLALFKSSLGCEEIGRHYDEEKRVYWGLFKSAFPFGEG